MNPFAKLNENKPTDIQGEDDRLGGFQIHPTDVYPATIKMAYSGKSSGGAGSMTYEVLLENGSTFRWTEWVTSGDKKGNLPYTEKDGKKTYLPGYNRANSIALMTAGKELPELAFEEKLVKIYNAEAKAEVPTPVAVAVELLNQKILLGIQQVISNKSVNVGTKEAPDYKDTNEKRESNEVDKVFHYETRRTLKEALAKVEKGEFIDKWIEQNKGKPRDKFKEVTGAPSAGSPAAGGAKPTESLFG